MASTSAAAAGAAAGAPGRGPKPPTPYQPQGWRERVAGALDEFFEIPQRGSTVAAEVRAGLVSFLTMSYILLVNPQILSQVRALFRLVVRCRVWRFGRPALPTDSTDSPPPQIGFTKSDVVVATAVGSGLASLTCGVFGNLPFGLAPGTGLSAYLSYGLVLSGVLTRPQAMTVCFFSGAFIFSFLGVGGLVFGSGSCTLLMDCCV